MSTTTTPSDSNSRWAERFTRYFDRPIAQEAARSLSDGAEMEFRITGADGKTLDTFTFTRKAGRNHVIEAPAQSPQVAFLVTSDAAEAILADPAEDIGQIGVNILKLVFSGDANRRVAFKLKAGFLTLFAKGYFGVVTAGGSAFASYLASRGLNGMGAIKAALKKIKE